MNRFIYTFFFAPCIYAELVTIYSFSHTATVDFKEKDECFISQYIWENFSSFFPSPIRESKKIIIMRENETTFRVIIQEKPVYFKQNDFYVCYMCNDKFQSRQAVQVHAYKHDGTQLYCTQCSRKFINRHRFSKHKCDPSWFQ